MCLGLGAPGARCLVDQGIVEILLVATSAQKAEPSVSSARSATFPCFCS